MKEHDKSKGPLKIYDDSLQIQKKASKSNNCHFYWKSTHFQKDLPKRKSWFEKKGELNAYAYFESNLTEVPHNTWWIDFGCTTHVSNTMQEFLTIKTISPNEKFVFMGNRVKAPTEVVRTYCLKLDTEHLLDVPILSRNLVSLSKLDVIEYSFNFGYVCFSLFKHIHVIGTSVFCYGLYNLKLNSLYVETLLHHNVGTKRNLVNGKFVFLWHKHVGHISRGRMERLIKNEILHDLILWI